ncbi:unnamed protein product, partial [Cylicostephanus goldi]
TCIFRIYKLTTKGVVDVLQFFVPRKSDLFQHDLYPDTRSTVPALTAEEFMEGVLNYGFYLLSFTFQERALCRIYNP